MTQNERDEYILRWAKALWQSQIDSGHATTSEPITENMREMMLQAAAAAVAVVDYLPVWARVEKASG